MHHLDIGAALPRIFDYLKPGGTMCFAEPNMLNPQIMLQKNIGWLKERLGDSPDETAFFRWPFQSALASAGFCDIRITPFDWLHPATPPALIRPLQRIGKVAEELPVVREFAGSLLIAANRPEV